MRVLVTLQIPKQLSEKLDRYKSKYYPVGFRKIGSHITLKPPFDLNGDFDNLVSVLQIICRGIKPFEVRIDGVQSFHDRIVCFKLTCPTEFLELRNVVKKCIDEKYKRESLRKIREEDEYKPHIAVALVTPRTAAKYVKMLADEKFSAIFLANSIELYMWRGNKWHLRKDIVFAGK